jgi:hypothetical protein
MLKTPKTSQETYQAHTLSWSTTWNLQLRDGVRRYRKTAAELLEEPQALDDLPFDVDYSSNPRNRLRKQHRHEDADKFAEKRRAYSKAYRILNREKILLTNKKVYYSDPQKSIAANLAWRKANPERVAFHSKKYQAKNREKLIARRKLKHQLRKLVKEIPVLTPENS